MANPQKGSMSPFQWLAATGTAGAGGVMAMMAYLHSSFVPAGQMEQHLSQPHSGAVSVEQYREDIRYLRQQLESMNRKLDALMQKVNK